MLGYEVYFGINGSMFNKTFTEQCHTPLSCIKYNLFQGVLTSQAADPIQV